MSSVVIAGDTSGTVTLAAPAVAGTTTLTLPTVTGTVLTTTSPKPGNVIQVVNVYDRQQSSYTASNIGNTYTNYGFDAAGFDLTTLDVTITPSSTSSKILLLTSISLGNDDETYGVMRLKRGIGGATPTFSSSSDWISANNSVPGTKILAGSYNATSRATPWTNRNIHFQWLDSPNTTSAVVYRFNFILEADLGTTVYLNRSFYNTNDYGATSSVSSVTLMEVAG